MSFAPFSVRNPVEYLAASVLQGEGYLVRNGIPLRVMQSGRDVTDIDVLGLKFTKPFQPHRIVCDCKDKQRSKPYERVFWTRGLADFVHADDAYVVLPKASAEVMDFAKAGQLRVLTHQVLQEAHSRIYGRQHAPVALANADFYEPFGKKVLADYKRLPEADQILYRARSLYLTEDPYVDINIGLSDLAQTAAAIARCSDCGSNRLEIWRYVAADLIVAISVLIVYIAADTLGLHPPERERRIIERLTFGDISPDKAKEIISLAQELARRTIEPEPGAAALPPVSIDAPSYASDVVGLVERAIRAPELYHELPQVLDFLLFEIAMQGKQMNDEESRRAVPVALTTEKLKVARNILSFARDATGLNLSAVAGREEPRTGEASRQTEMGASLL